MHIYKAFVFFIAVNIDLRIDCESQSPQTALSTNVRGSPSSTQEVLNYIARRFFHEIDVLNPDKLTGFLRYLKKERKVSVVNIREESIIFKLGCRSLQILDELWEDYSTGHLTEVAQMNLVTQDILKLFGLSSLKLTLNIKEEDYRDCRQRLETDDGKYGKNVVYLQQFRLRL